TRISGSSVARSAVSADGADWSAASSFRIGFRRFDFNQWDGDVVVLVSFLLVLAAAVTLVIGLLNSGLGLIYVSIACSVLAGIVLAVAVLRSRPRAEVQTGGPAPLPEPATVGGASGAAATSRAAAQEPTRTDLDVVEEEPAAVGAGANG